MPQKFAEVSIAFWPGFTDDDPDVKNLKVVKENAVSYLLEGGVTIAKNDPNLMRMFEHIPGTSQVKEIPK